MEFGETELNEMLRLASLGVAGSRLGGGHVCCCSGAVSCSRQLVATSLLTLTALTMNRRENSYVQHDHHQQTDHVHRSSGKRACNTSLYHSRQCGIVLKSLSGRIASLLFALAYVARLQPKVARTVPVRAECGVETDDVHGHVGSLVVPDKRIVQDEVVGLAESNVHVHQHCVTRHGTTVLSVNTHHIIRHIILPPS